MVNVTASLLKLSMGRVLRLHLAMGSAQGRSLSCDQLRRRVKPRMIGGVLIAQISGHKQGLPLLRQACQWLCAPPLGQLCAECKRPYKPSASSIASRISSRTSVCAMQFECSEVRVDLGSVRQRYIL